MAGGTKSVCMDGDARKVARQKIEEMLRMVADGNLTDNPAAFSRVLRKRIGELVDASK